MSISYAANPAHGMRRAGAFLHGALDRGIEKAAAALRGRQKDDGHWVFELEADATIPSEYVLLKHYLDEIDPALERRIGNYLRETQADHGGWPLYHGGAFDVSATVKAYFALKAIGDPVDAPHMARARDAVLAHGGAEKANVFTRTLLALFGEVPWHAVPVMPVEIMLLPEWFPFHLNKVSYWSRTVIVPLLVLMALKPRARNPHQVHIPELFVTPAEAVRDWLQKPDDTWIATALIGLDAVLRRAEPMIPGHTRERAIARALDFVRERLNGADGLGAIYPAMANTVMMFDALGFPADHPELVTAKESIERLLIVEEDRAYCQPCVSPIWDTALACHALQEVERGSDDDVLRGLDWLVDRQVLDLKGDWAAKRPELAPGGWPFQYGNGHYPDLDDTAVVVMAMERADPTRYAGAIDRAMTWMRGMQSANGGWGAFDVDNDYDYLNHIPFADHGALLDPPTADVSARCLSAIRQAAPHTPDPGVETALAYLRREQEVDGSWFGRWGTNYIYGTWSVLCALNAAGVGPDAPEMRRAVNWLEAHQKPDGGWGESGGTYWSDTPPGTADHSTASQTAWALLALMAAGEVDSDAVARGVQYLLDSQNEDGEWDEADYTAVGFPRVFYLRYHGYRFFFPLWALARYRNLKASNAPTTPYGM
jgi:squalene-hopene/tetraprenyl-beta-curcumene cyclase